DIVIDYARRNNFNNVNIEHNSKNVVDGLHMIMSYQIDNERGFTAPERFKDANDGSWLVSYKVSDDQLWKDAKEGKFKGFSIEGVFNLIDTKRTMTEEQMMSAILEALQGIKFRTTKHNK
ncbi:MAG: hypothetical protein EBR91_11555, partial [Flavobacteriia bacterium]|nr:hypothetical protein [Flavobacteriia bacterium]